MVVTTREPSDSTLCSLWHRACNDYARETGISLLDESFPKLEGPEALSRQLDSEKDPFEDFRMKRRPLFHAMQMILTPFEDWGDLIAGSIATAFPPASSIMGAMVLLVRAARRVSDAFNSIVDLFHKLGNFALRLESYKGVTLSEGMKTIVAKVMVNILRVCAASQNILSRGSLKGRLSKWAKNMLTEDASIKSLLSELEELTSLEHMMVSAHGLNLTHQALRNTEELLNRDDSRHERERLERVKAALNPVSASGQVFSSISQNRLPGSGSWIEDRLWSWWRGSEQFLWLHGGPGVGKSHLASKIITDLSTESLTTPAPVIASFFYKNNDVDLRSLNRALRALAWQLATQEINFAVHAEEFCMREDPGNNLVLWEKLFLNYFNRFSSASPMCLVFDGIDEAESQEQEVLFSLLGKAAISHNSPLRIVLLSRDSVRVMLEDHLLDWIPEIEVGDDQNKDDLHQYVSQKLQKTRLFRGYPEFLEETIDDISQKAEGLWEWANLVIKAVLRCRTKEHIRNVVKTMPQGISAMLREELQRLGRALSSDKTSDEEGPAAHIEQLNLDIVLELLLNEEFMGLEHDIRTLYSSLFYIRANDDRGYSYEDAEVVTLRHSSFYEFFRMPGQSRPIYVDVNQAEVSFLYVCLYALIENYTPSSDRSISELWSYAEKYLPSHLIHADPEKAEYLRGETSTLLARLFSKASYAEWFIVELHFMGFGSYSFYPTCHLSGLGSYWLDAQDQNTANWRAETVLHWLLPDQKQGFVDYARSSSVGSDACSFTILLSILVACWSQRWLEPEEIKENDGFPEIAPAILTIYNTMAKGTKGSDVEDILPRVENVMWDHGEPAQVLTPAQSQKLQQTPMWHARVAQALLLKHCYVQAIEHFQISIDENQKAPTFSAQTLSVILRDMSRAYTEVAMHKEALEYLEISDNLRSTFAENDSRNINRPVEALLHRAQMKYRANLTDDAIAIAEEAWNLVLEEWGVNRDVNFLLFFEIFLELGQVHRLRSVFDFASCPLDDTAGNRNNSLDLGLSILDSFRSRPRLMYRVLHYALAQDGQYYLDLTARALKDDETDLKDSTESKYLLATVLFEKGQRDVAVESWYEVASLSSASSNMWDKPSYMRSIGKLVTFCLGDAERLSWGRPPLTLETETELGDICLLLSTWLRDCGDLTYARDALRWCVKQCISLLSDDDPSNDINAFIGLFKVFLVATDSDEDLEVALYLIKQDTEPRMRVSRNRTDVTKRTDDDVQLGLSSTLHHAQLTGWEDQYLEEGNDSYIADVFYAGLVCDPLTECSSCKREIGSMHHWYFCRSCVNSTLCRRCYRQFESDSQSRLSGICNPDHHFYYTGSLLRPSERVPKGMVPLKLPGDEQRIIWVEEWKDRIAEKWDTASFTFDGGLFAWCMRVLPEPQRARWATMFQT